MSTRNWNSGFRHLVQTGTEQCEVLYFKFNLNIQTSYKSDETCLVVSSTQCTPTHFKESSWVTIWIWKIKMSQHVNSLLPIRAWKDLWEPKGALYSNLRPLFEPLRSWIRAWSKNKVCCTPLKLQHLFKVKLHISSRDHCFILVKAASR